MEQPEPSRPGTHAERCLCGNQVARLGPRGVEILCRRCKRVHRIPWATAGAFEAEPMRHSGR